MILKLKLSNPSHPELQEQVEARIDVDEIWTTVPRELGTRLSLESMSTIRRPTRKGWRMSEQSFCLMEYEGRVSALSFAYEDDASEVVLGSVGLLTLGLAIDSQTGELIDQEIYLLEMVA